MCNDKYLEALEELMDSFLERYSPADTWQESNEQYTSTEILEMFNSVYPIPMEDIYEQLREKGFKCVPVSGQGKFVWLLQTRSWEHFKASRFGDTIFTVSLFLSPRPPRDKMNRNKSVFYKKSFSKSATYRPTDLPWKHFSKLDKHVIRYNINI